MCGMRGMHASSRLQAFTRPERLHLIREPLVLRDERHAVLRSVLALLLKLHALSLQRGHLLAQGLVGPTGFVKLLVHGSATKKGKVKRCSEKKGAAFPTLMKT